MILSDVVSSNSMIARSVSLERDLGNEKTLGQYFLTGKGLEIISRLTAGLNGERISAWSLTGPYGMGKSSFANFLLSLCGPEQEKETRTARKMLKDKDAALYQNFCESLANRRADVSGFFRVPAISAFEPVHQTLAKGLHAAAAGVFGKSRGNKDHNAFVENVKALIHQKDSDPQQLAALFKEAGQLYGAPVAVFIDEFGKNLEFMARYPEKGDIFILQSLAETEHVYVWVCLHQAFEEYVSGMSNRQRQEWGKIQGRFEDIPFIEPRHQMLDFIARTLIRKTDVPGLDEGIGNWADAFYKEMTRLHLREFESFDAKAVQVFFPLHPAVALMLPELCVRFAQNDRTLFAFLCSGEPRALPNFLSLQPIDPEAGRLATMGPERLYDYFLSSASGAFMNRPESGRWIEIHSLIEGAKHLSETEYRILKIIGLLNLISGHSGFRASENMLCFVCFKPSDSGTAENLRELLTGLIQRGILFYRAYADEYRLWEGTDFDISLAIRRQRERIAGLPLDKILAQTLPLHPLTAARHSYQTGTLRHFERQWCSQSGLEEMVRGHSSETDGLICYCFGTEGDWEKYAALTGEVHWLVIAYTAYAEQIREMVLEAGAAKAVLEKSPELERDGVARKEAKFRAIECEIRLKRYLDDLFAPGNPEVAWYAGGKVHELRSHRDLSRLISERCDQVYASCPVIRNELINRNQLSSAAAGARRALIESMVLNENKPRLGMKGTGPEVAIYRTMLLAEGLHRETENGSWHFVPPDTENAYYPAWKAIETAAEGAGDAHLPVPEIINMLRQAPFGMKEGPIPVLFCLFLVIKADEIALYQEDAFVPVLAPEEMELMVKRPEYFSVKRFAPIGIQGKVFQIYRDLLNASPVSDDQEVRNATMVGVVGPLVQFAGHLNDYARNTRMVSKEAGNVRHALLQAKDPLQLLFADLPGAVGMPAFDEATPVPDESVKDFQIRFRSALAELAHAYQRLTERIQEIVTAASGSEKEIGKLRAELKRRAKPLIQRCGDKTLKPFAAALARDAGTDTEWLVSVATVVRQKPADAWRDSDVQVFSARMTDMMNRLRALEAIAAAEKKLPKPKKGKDARWVAVARADGKMRSEVFWLEKSRLKDLKADLASFEKKYSPEDLQGLFVLLGEALLKTEN